MGHERVGFLPRTRQWRALVEDISSAAETPDAISSLTSATMRQVSKRFDGIHTDSGFQAAFSFLVALTTDAPTAPTRGPYPAFDESTTASPIRLTAQLRAWVDDHAQSLEYAELAKRAGADTITFWTRERTRQSDLFRPTSETTHVWGVARTGAAFSEICRVYFGKFAERYISYFLDREASSQLPTIQARERFATSLKQHVDAIARHAFETTKITESFAAGWYNKHAQQSRPTQAANRSFLAFAMSKLRQELLRESANE